MAKPTEGMSISLQHFADDGSTEGGSPAAANADLLKNAFGAKTDAAGADGNKPADKPKQGDKEAGGTGTGSGVKLAAWTEQLPAEYRDNPEIAAKFASFGKLGDWAKAYLELEGKAGGVVYPGKEASAQAAAEFWEKAGKPKNAEGYSFANDTKSEGAAFAQAAFAANLTEMQAAAMLKSLNEIGEKKQKAGQEMIRRQQAETAAVLQEEYGSRFKEHMTLLERGLRAAGPNVANILVNAGVAGEPEIVKAFIAFGKMTAESGFQRGDGAGESPKSILSGEGSFEYK